MLLFAATTPLPVASLRVLPFARANFRERGFKIPKHSTAYGEFPGSNTFHEAITRNRYTGHGVDLGQPTHTHTHKRLLHCAGIWNSAEISYKRTIWHTITCLFFTQN